MSDSREVSEDILIAELRQGLDESDAVPTDVTDFARAALAWRSIDAELAQISFDSVTETAEAVRSTVTTRLLSFMAGRWTIDIEYDDHTRRLLGQVTPSMKVIVELHFAGGALGIYSDDSGRFDFDDVLPGPISLVIRTSGDLEVVKTEWTVL